MIDNIKEVNEFRRFSNTFRVSPEVVFCEIVRLHTFFLTRGTISLENVYVTWDHCFPFFLDLFSKRTNSSKNALHVLRI